MVDEVANNITNKYLVLPSVEEDDANDDLPGGPIGYY